MGSYDRAITVFSPDGHLFQVEYALEAVRKGATAVGIRGEKVIVLGVEKKSTAKLQESRTVQKICKLDDHLTLAFAGLTADARVLINKARIECQSYRLTVEDASSVEYIARYISKLQQQYTQRGGRRPFGISTLVCGHDKDGTPHLYQTMPSGVYSEWKANAIGSGAKTVTEFLGKFYDEEEKKMEKERKGQDDSFVSEEEDRRREAAQDFGPKLSEAQCVKLTIQSLLEVVEAGAKNIEIAIMKPGTGLELMDQEDVTAICKEIEKEKEEKENAKKKKKKGKK